MVVAGALPCAGVTTVASEVVPVAGGASVVGTSGTPGAPGASGASARAEALVAGAVAVVVVVGAGPAAVAEVAPRMLPQRRSTVVVAAADSVSLRTVTWRVPSCQRCGGGADLWSAGSPVAPAAGKLAGGGGRLLVLCDVSQVAIIKVSCPRR
ncbi:hypothetical protein VR45_33385 [Streptomyces sp. NRRL S-495]|nr:hypothetical protein VR45_33385 [Streptomyces sp. NRRL S-495]